MKRIISNLIVITCAIITFLATSTESLAQNATSDIGITGGFSGNNSKFLSLTIETSKNSYNTWGMVLDGIWYSNKENDGLNWKANNKILALGLFYKIRISSTKNFNTGFLFGGSGGSDNHKFIYYPFGGFEENIFLNENLVLTFNQKAAYFLGYPNFVHWQPTLNIGLKVGL